jgi:hypothetical protein
MSQKAQWITIKSNNLRCWECKQKLENFLIAANYQEANNGMLQRKYNLFSGEIRIQYLPDRVTPDILRYTINEAGFDADSTKADVEAYKKLPPICKRAEDGGGPQLRKNCQIEPINF